ncbi:MAG: phage minor head protein [Anaerolineales bacterium]
MPEGEIFDAIERFRRELLANERQAASEMVRVYGEAWKRIGQELDHLQVEYEAAKARGERPDADWIFRFNRARAFRDQVERELLAFAQYAEGKVREQQLEAIEAAERHAEELTRRALGKPPAGLVVDWNRIDRVAVETILGMVQVNSPLHRLLLSISREGAQAAEDALVQGMLLGQNPREVARAMRRALGTTLSRALTIARTETLRAHREATRASYQANSDVVKGWVWHSAADERTCAACWAMHGTEHRLDEILDDHPNGRCAMIPKTRTWAEIGRQYGIDLSDIPDTNPQIELGVSLFEKLSQEQQIKILGPAKYAAWRDGKFALSDIVGRARSREWGTHRYEKSLAELLGAEKAKGYTRLALMGAAKDAGQYSVSDLIRIAGLGLRELNDDELQRIVEKITKAGFNREHSSLVKPEMAGIFWGGKYLKVGERLPTDEWHFVKHVLVRQEWPEGTSLTGYLDSLRAVIRNPESGIMISKYQGIYWQVAFIMQSGEYRGVGGGDFILVEYRDGYGFWITGFQPVDLQRQLQSYRSDIRWLRKIK